MDKPIEQLSSSRFLPFRGHKLDMTIKEIIPLREIELDNKLHKEIGISFRNHLKEIVRGILFM